MDRKYIIVTAVCVTVVVIIIVVVVVFLLMKLRKRNVYDEYLYIGECTSCDPDAGYPAKRSRGKTVGNRLVSHSGRDNLELNGVQEDKVKAVCPPVPPADGERPPPLPRI